MSFIYIVFTKGQGKVKRALDWISNIEDLCFYSSVKKKRERERQQAPN